MPNQDHVIVPLTEQDQEALGMREEFKNHTGTIGMVLLRSRIREGVKRWEKRDAPPDVFEGATVVDSVRTLSKIVENMRSRHADEIRQMQSEARQQGKTDAEVSYNTKKNEAERLSKLQQRRLDRKDTRIEELKADKTDQAHQITTYRRDFGDLRTRPLNRLQRFICSLFRIRG